VVRTDREMEEVVKTDRKMDARPRRIPCREPLEGRHDMGEAASRGRAVA
jgi:hypothetical protein